MEYLKTYNIALSSHFDGVLGNHQRKDWKVYITPENKSMVSPEAFDLLDKMLVYDHVNPFIVLAHPLKNTLSPFVYVF